MENSAPATVTLTVNAVNDVPVAAAGGPYSGTVDVPVTFDGTGSSDVDGTITDYAWDFGDGNTGSGATPSHTYAANGSFTVTLVVTDDLGATGTEVTSAAVAPAGATVTVDSIAPNTIAIGSSAPVLIFGSGFAEGATLVFENGTGPAPTATEVVVVDANNIQAILTAASGGPGRDRVWDVRVLNVDGSSGVLLGGLTITPTP
jgi:PKD repeat protein